MKTHRAIVAGFCACLVSHSSFGASSPEATQAVRAFQELCATGTLSPQAVLARADASGWRVDGPNKPKGFDPANQRLAPMGEPPLMLNVSTESSLGERRDACSIGIDLPNRGLAEATQDWLRFAPTFAMAKSATYAALRDGDAWRSGAALTHAEFATAKAEGRFYSIMVGDRGTEEPDEGYPAFVMMLHVQPIQQQGSGR